MFICSDCLAPLEPEDGHTKCPACLGIDHLRQGLTEEACMNCSCLSLAARAARLAQVEEAGTSQAHEQAGKSPAMRPSRRRGSTARRAPSTKRRRVDLAQRVDSMATEFEKIKELLVNLQPAQTARVGVPAETPPAGQVELPPPSLSPVGAPEEDALSTRASESWDLGQGEGAEPYESAPHDSQSSSLGTAQSTAEDPGVGRLSVKGTLKMALARLGLDPAPVAAPPHNAFFRGAVQQTAFVVPPSAPYIEELQRCWADPRQLSHRPSDCRALSAMQGASTYGLEAMPSIEPSVAALVLSPDEALRPHARCPRPQCRLTDDLIVKSYDTAACMGRIGNSMSHLMLSLTQTLQDTEGASASQDLCDSSLQAFAYMTRELGRLMSYLTLARRQIWLAQSPLAEPGRRALRSLPVVPGELFGQAAQQALERSVQVIQARRQFASLRRESPARRRPPTPRAATPVQAPTNQQGPQYSQRFRRPTSDRTRRPAQGAQTTARYPSRDQRGRAGRR